ncbi:MAG TPA: hypothetical protein VGO68_15915 [Pyrinomonadaceae bacterium]|jgi:hypothetical protein|nr:hypothetical protein [Pyrinomonadaceae bacterium]
MFLAALMMFARETTANMPTYFIPVFFGMFLVGTVAWLVAAVLGFARARAFGPSARWFSFAAVCLLLFHIQVVAAGFGVVTNDTGLAFSILTFLNLFIILGAFCAVMGFIRLTNPR